VQGKEEVGKESTKGVEEGERREREV